jgi:hypothetical protein
LDEQAADRQRPGVGLDTGLDRLDIRGRRYLSSRAAGGQQRDGNGQADAETTSGDRLCIHVDSSRTADVTTSPTVAVSMAGSA